MLNIDRLLAFRHEALELFLEFDNVSRTITCPSSLCEHMFVRDRIKLIGWRGAEATSTIIEACVVCGLGNLSREFVLC